MPTTPESRPLCKNLPEIITLEGGEGEFLDFFFDDRRETGESQKNQNKCKMLLISLLMIFRRKEVDLGMPCFNTL